MKRFVHLVNPFVSFASLSKRLRLRQRSEIIASLSYVCKACFSTFFQDIDATSS